MVAYLLSANPRSHTDNIVIIRQLDQSVELKFLYFLAMQT